MKNYVELVEKVMKALRYPNRESEEGAGIVTREVAAQIYWRQDDKDFGLLRKRPGQTQYLGCGIDALLHKPTGIVIDIITASGTEKSKAAWQVQDKPEFPRYPASDWVEPPQPLLTLGEQPQQPPQDPPKSDLQVVADAILGLTSIVQVLEARVEAMAARLAQEPPPHPPMVGRGKLGPFSFTVTITPQE